LQFAFLTGGSNPANFPFLWAQNLLPITLLLGTTWMSLQMASHSIQRLYQDVTDRLHYINTCCISQRRWCLQTFISVCLWCVVIRYEGRRPWSGSYHWAAEEWIVRSARYWEMDELCCSWQGWRLDGASLPITSLQLYFALHKWTCDLVLTSNRENILVIKWRSLKFDYLHFANDSHWRQSAFAKNVFYQQDWWMLYTNWVVSAWEE